jgi:hypothetical protein
VVVNRVKVRNVGYKDEHAWAKLSKRGTCGQHVDSKRAQRVGYISIHVATLDLPKDPTVGWLNGGGGALIWHRSDPRGFQNLDRAPKTPRFRMKLGARLGEPYEFAFNTKL